MAKAKMYPVIIDRSVTVELKGKPTITYPAGWRGAVNKATLKVIKDMEAGREVDGDGSAQADADTSDADIKAKHDAADAEIKTKHADADAVIAKALKAAEDKAEALMVDAEKKVKAINDAANPNAGKAGG